MSPSFDGTPLFLPRICSRYFWKRSRSHRKGEASKSRLDCRLDKALPKDARLQSRDAGKRLIGGLLAPKGDRLIERYRASVLAGDSPGHLAVIHALRASLFHLPPRLMMASYLLQEGVGAGLDGREIARFLIGSLIGTEGVFPSGGVFVAES